MGWIPLVVGIILVLFAIEFYISNNVMKKSQFIIKSSKIGKQFQGYKILHLSDLHGKVFGKENCRLIKIINDIHPDIIVMTGDMVNGNHKDFKVLYDLIQKISKYPIYFVMGNHEDNMKDEMQQKLLDFLKQSQVNFLNNEEIIIEREKDKLSVWGMCCDFSYYGKGDHPKQFTLSAMKNMMNESPNRSRFNILLAHNPNFFEVCAKWGADLVLSGHIHGGMVRLPLIGGVFSPDTLFFPKYSNGVYTFEDKKLIVSRGVGRGRRGFRFFNRPEIGVIILESETD